MKIKVSFGNQKRGHGEKILRLRLLSVSVLAALAFSGCAAWTVNQNIVAGLVGTSVTGVAPTANLAQTYYVGIFDPRGQLEEPQFYRIRVRGQSSQLSQVNFASGWVRSEFVDSLSTVAKFNSDDGKIEFTKEDDKIGSKLSSGRRLMLFGPEGFREAPADHRLVIVMGADPQKFFGAVDESLGIVARATQGQSSAAYDRALFEAILSVKTERERLDELIADAKKTKGAQ